MKLDNEDDRPLLRRDTVYKQIAANVWVDVDVLSVHIQRTKQGVTVEIWPIVDDDSNRPLARADAAFDAVKMPRLRKRIMNQVRKVGEQG